MFSKSRGTVQLTVELLDTEEENSDEPMEVEVGQPHSSLLLCLFCIDLSAYLQTNLLHRGLCLWHL